MYFWIMNLRFIITSYFCLPLIGFHIEWKGSKVSAQLDRGAGMCTSGCRCSVLAWPPIFICGYTFKVACVKGGELKIKEFAPRRGGLCRGQRSSLQYAQLKVSKSCKSNPETADQESVCCHCIDSACAFEMGSS